MIFNEFLRFFRSPSHQTSFQKRDEGFSKSQVFLCKYCTFGRFARSKSQAKNPKFAGIIAPGRCSHIAMLRGSFWDRFWLRFGRQNELRRLPEVILGDVVSITKSKPRFRSEKPGTTDSGRLRPEAPERGRGEVNLSPGMRNRKGRLDRGQRGYSRRLDPEGRRILYIYIYIYILEHLAREAGHHESQEHHVNACDK